MWDDICANYPSLILQCIHGKCPVYNYYTIATCAITVCQLTIKIQGWRYSLVTEMVCLPGMRETRGWMPSIQSKNTEGAGRRWLSVKSTCGSSQGPRFNAQHQRGSSQLPDSGSRGLMPSLWTLWAPGTFGVHKLSVFLLPFWKNYACFACKPYKPYTSFTSLTSMLQF